MDLKQFTKKWHGLPIWAWAAIAAGVLVLGFLYIKKRQGTSSSAASSPAASTADTSGDSLPLSSLSGGGGFTPDSTQSSPGRSHWTGGNPVVTTQTPTTSSDTPAATSSPSPATPAAEIAQSPVIAPVISTTPPASPSASLAGAVSTGGNALAGAQQFLDNDSQGALEAGSSSVSGAVSSLTPIDSGGGLLGAIQKGAAKTVPVEAPTVDKKTGTTTTKTTPLPKSSNAAQVKKNSF